LILGLLATAKLGGQVLFSVEINPGNRTVQITPTGNVPAPLASVDEFALNTNLNDGITLINLFAPTSTIPVSTSLTGFGIPNSLALFKLETDPQNPENQFLTGPSFFDRAVVFGPESLTFRSGDQTARQELPTNPENPLNSGKNLNLYIENDNRDPFDLRFTAPNTTPSTLVITFPVGQTVEAYSGGPHYVYAGLNNVAFGQDPLTLANYTSFLGTYTVTVVPEPSTYAAIAGGLGLLAAVLHRRRQRSRASAA
jgi:hypothetical protein